MKIPGHRPCKLSSFQRAPEVPSRALEAYRMLSDKSDDCTKAVLDPTR